MYDIENLKSLNDDMDRIIDILKDFQSIMEKQSNINDGFKEIIKGINGRLQLIEDRLDYLESSVLYSDYD